MKQLTYLLLLLSFSFSSYLQEEQVMKTYENEECRIKYPSNLILKENPTKAVFYSPFIISNLGEKTDFNFPMIRLSVIDASLLGMGIHGVMDGIKKTKSLETRKSTANATEFFIATSESDGIIRYEYIFVKENKVYTLFSISKSSQHAANKEYIESIMNTFELK